MSAAVSISLGWGVVLGWGIFFGLGVVVGGWAVHGVMKPRLAGLRGRLAERAAGGGEGRAAMEAVAAEVLVGKAKELGVANREWLKEAMGPLQEKLEAYSGEIRRARERGVETQARLEGALRAAVMDMKIRTEAVGKEASALARAFRGERKTQGNWGEMTLEGILEGMELRAGREYRKQVALRGRDGKLLEGRAQIPDIVLCYADGRELAVDSKVSLMAFAEYVNMEEGDRAGREAAAARHVAAVRAQIEVLAKKDYPGAIRRSGRKSADYVVMFLPNEGAFHLLLERAPLIWGEAFRRQVLLVSPLLLPPLLQLIRMGWVQVEQERNQAEILRTAGKLVEGLQRFYGHMGVLGEALEKARASFGEAVGKLAVGRGNVIRTGERLIELGVRSSRGGGELPEILRAAAEGGQGVGMGVLPPPPGRS